MRVTTKGQVTIPRDVREALGISPETEIEFLQEVENLKNSEVLPRLICLPMR
jgi:AbrB family looped-hinge helix DNA binding protein